MLEKPQLGTCVELGSTVLASIFPTPSRLFCTRIELPRLTSFYSYTAIKVPYCVRT